MYELSILKSFLLRTNYLSYRNYFVPSAELKPVLEAIDLWYKNHTTDPALIDIVNLTFAQNVKDKDYLAVVFDSLSNLGGTETVRELLEGMQRNKLYEEISVAAYEVAQGKKHPEQLQKLIAKLSQPAVEKDEYVTDDINDLLDSTLRIPGLRWPLDSFNKSLGSLRKGNFGFIFARPETGKTTFLAHVVGHMAKQLGEDSGPIIWINNEEQGKVVKLRIIQATLGATTKAINERPDKASEAYRQATKGKIKLIDNATLNHHSLRRICQQEGPSLLVIDQIDKLHGASQDRKDLELGEIYQGARELAKSFCPVIGVCQADGTAEGEKWLHMGHVSNAKTSKQAEADFIIGIGKVFDTNFRDIRFVNISKNKLTGDTDSLPHARHAQFSVLIKPDVAKYEDLDVL